jgi:hypothetical protein
MPEDNGQGSLGIIAVSLLGMLCCSPVNLPLQLWMCDALEHVYGSYVADNSPGQVLLLTIVAGPASYAAVSLPVYFYFRRRSPRRCWWALLVVTGGYWALWFGLFLVTDLP